MTSAPFILIYANAVALFMLWLFLSAGASKLQPKNREFYTASLNDYGVVLPDLARILVLLLGIVEVLAAAFIIVPASRLLGALLCGALLLIYFCVIGRKILQGKTDMDCGCSGPGGGIKLSPMLLLRNALLIALLVVFLFSSSYSNEYSLAFNQGLSFESYLLSLVFALMMGFIHLSAENLLATQQKLVLLRQYS